MIGLPLNIKQYREKRRYQMYLLHIQIKSIDPIQGRIQDFKLRGVHLKKLRRAEGGAKIFWVFRVKNHNFTPKNHFFSNFGGGGAPGAHTPPPGSAPAINNISFILRDILLDYNSS
jgi:hypothetical protein